MYDTDNTFLGISQKKEKKKVVTHAKATTLTFTLKIISKNYYPKGVHTHAYTQRGKWETQKYYVRLHVKNGR